jgi:vancomycin permeability regulator SanA
MRRILNLGLRALAFIAAVWLLAALALVWAGLQDRVIDADLIVVPGNTVAADGTPSPRLQARLDAALTLYRAHHAPLIFVSGGIGKEGFDEALSMAAYLVKNGVPSSAIIRDNQGITTMATARNAAAFMRAHQLSSALIATQYFHVARLQLALERNGIGATGSLHASYFELRDFYSIPREVLGYVPIMLGHFRHP